MQADRNMTLCTQAFASTRTRVNLRMHACMYTHTQCARTHTCPRMHTRVRIHTRTHTCTCTHTHTHARARIHTPAHAHTHTHTGTHVHAHAGTDTETYTYTHAYTHTHTDFGTFFLFFCYRFPNFSPLTFFSLLSDRLEQATNFPTFFLGKFNAKHPLWNAGPY